MMENTTKNYISNITRITYKNGVVYTNAESVMNTCNIDRFKINDLWKKYIKIKSVDGNKPEKILINNKGIAKEILHDEIKTVNRTQHNVYYEIKYGGESYEIRVSNKGMTLLPLDFAEFVIEETIGKIESTEIIEEETEEIVEENIENDLTVFEHSEFGKIRTVERDGEIWFVGKDIAEILGYTNTNKAIKDHVDVEDKSRWVTNRYSLNENSHIIIINESGLYSLILSSKLPKAKQFKKWVTAEVLPSIRKHGAYMTPDTIEKAILNPDIIIKLATELKAEQEKSRKLSEKNSNLEIKTELLTENISKWTNRSTINAIVRKMSGTLCLSFSVVYGIIYKELLYRYGIGLKQRASHDIKHKSYISYVKEDEWGKIESVIAALCEKNNIDSTEFFLSATNGVIKGN